MEVDLGYSRSARVVWEGALDSGQAEMTVESGALGSQPASFYARVNHPKRKQQTTPEELLAAACALDYAMAFSALLTEGGHPPGQITVDAVCTLDRLVEGGFRLASIKLDVKGRVPGLDDAEFQRFAAEADIICPTLSVLREDMEVTVQVAMESD